MGAPEPEQIYERTRIEGERRLERPVVELASTALAAGFDIAAGVAFLAVTVAALRGHFGDAARVPGAIAFGTGFVFLIVGRGELFTENFLVPLAGLEGKARNAWWKVAELWTVSPVFNIAAGAFFAFLLSVHRVLPQGSGAAMVDVASKLHDKSTLTSFVSAVFAGALMTAMTWFVEGQHAVGVRVVVAWASGALLALAGLNHVIVGTIELIFGMRYGADIPWLYVLGNFALAAAGNMLGGVGLVTLNRFTQARPR